MSDPWKMIEPVSPGLAESDDQRLQLSIAISLKRIADVLAPEAGQDIGSTLFYIEQRLGQAVCQ